MTEPSQAPFSFTDAKPAKGGTQTAAPPAPPLANAEIPRRRGPNKPVAAQPSALPTVHFLQIIEMLHQHDIKTARRIIRALTEFWG